MLNEKSARLHRINDVLTALTSEFDVTLPDETLSELTHCVADVFDGGEVVAVADVLTDEEAKLIACFRASDESGKAMILVTAGA